VNQTDDNTILPGSENNAMKLLGDTDNLFSEGGGQIGEDDDSKTKVKQSHPSISYADENQDRGDYLD
jgi:hypothetical protein